MCGWENINSPVGLADGNVSADSWDGTFYVKSSGGQMATIESSGFTRVKTKVILDALNQPDKSDEEIRKVLENSRVNPQEKLPSIKTFLHALCLAEGNTKWVGQAHPVSVVGVLSISSAPSPFVSMCSRIP